MDLVFTIGIHLVPNSNYYLVRFLLAKFSVIVFKNYLKIIKYLKLKNRMSLNIKCFKLSWAC